MHTIDYIIIAVYILALVTLGLYLQKSGGKSIDSFFLGDRKMPWWALGASGMSSNFDVSGTMIIVAMIYALGLKGFFIELRGGIVLIMAFLMVFMGKWNRRAQVMTAAEWMELRFGRDKAGNAARLLSAAANLLFAITVVTYFAQGGGIFLGKILGIDPDLAMITIVGLATLYTVASGLYGVVYTDVVQGFLVLFAILYTCYTAFFYYPLPDEFLVSVPLVGDGFQTLSVNYDSWTDIVPGWTMNLPGEYGQYNMFGIAILFYLFKTTIEGSGGSGGYLIQRYYAAKSDREAGLLSLFWIFLLAFRWPFVVAIAMMGIAWGASNSVIQNPEEVLPSVLGTMIPAGITGLIVAGLIAAAMSTFDSVVNSGAAYWVKDIYQRFINPDASEKMLVRHSRWSSVAIVVIGVLLTKQFENINDIWGWLTMGLGAGLIVPQVIRWYWWRFNGYGFAVGVIFGMIAAFAKLLFFPELNEYEMFIFVAAISLTGCLIGTYATPQVDNKILENFYRVTRPFGFWGTIKNSLSDRNIEQVDAENKRDILSTFFAVPWMLLMCITPMLFMVRLWSSFFVAIALLAGLSIALYFSWFRHLSTEVDMDGRPGLHPDGTPVFDDPKNTKN
ncbi:MAG: sodium:solute symporter [Balneolaceae bacterium]